MAIRPARSWSPRYLSRSRATRASPPPAHRRPGHGGRASRLRQAEDRRPGATPRSSSGSAPPRATEAIWPGPSSTPPAPAGRQPARRERRPGARRGGRRRPIAYGISRRPGRRPRPLRRRRVLVVGSGHSAINALLDLARLASRRRARAIAWAIRRPRGRPEVRRRRRRSAAGARQLGAPRPRAGREPAGHRAGAGFPIARLAARRTARCRHRPAGDAPAGATEIVVATGFRPDLALLASCASASTRRWRAPGAWRR